MKNPTTHQHFNIGYASIRSLCLLILLMTLTPIAIHAEMESNNIFIFDCTGSMRKANLWIPAQEALDKTISSRCKDQNAYFTIIPFGNDPYERLSFQPNLYTSQKETITNAFEQYIKKATTTNISAALKDAFSLCDPKKENKIYLLTDGKPESPDSPSQVAQTISDWCSTHKNTRLFYVALQQGVVPDQVAKAISMCDDAYVIECSEGIIPEITDISSHIHANIEELSTIHRIRFSNPGNYPVKAICDDPLFNIEIVGNKASNGIINLRIQPRNQMSVAELHQALSTIKDDNDTYTFNASIEAADKSFFIANPNVEISMADHLQSRLDFSEQEEFEAEPTSHYPAFLWSEASPLGSFAIDLKPIFTNVTERHASLTLRLTPADGEPKDFRVWFNDRELSPDAMFEVAPNQPAVLKIEYDGDALDGKRHFTLTKTGCRGLDLIGAVPANEFKSISIRSDYDLRHNPLAWILSIIGLIILGILILWFAIMRRIFFPSIKVSKIELAGPGGYYVSKKIKGSRKVILTSQKRSQNIISRLFTGKVLFIRADHFSPEIEIIPCGRDRKIRIRNILSKNNSDRWDFSPSATFSPYEKGDMRLQSNQTIKTEIQTM